MVAPRAGGCQDRRPVLSCDLTALSRSSRELHRHVGVGPPSPEPKGWDSPSSIYQYRWKSLWTTEASQGRGRGSTSGNSKTDAAPPQTADAGQRRVGLSGDTIDRSGCGTRRDSRCSCETMVFSSLRRSPIRAMPLGEVVRGRSGFPPAFCSMASLRGSKCLTYLNGSSCAPP